MNKMSTVWKLDKLESESSPVATCNICNMTVVRIGNKRDVFNTTNTIFDMANKKHSKLYNKFALVIQVKTLTQRTLSDTFKAKRNVLVKASWPKILQRG